MMVDPSKHYPNALNIGSRFHSRNNEHEVLRTPVRSPAPIATKSAQYSAKKEDQWSQLISAQVALQESAEQAKREEQKKKERDYRTALQNQILAARQKHMTQKALD
jgi:uncharacterized protein YceH (UPF0502 family)